MASSETPNGDYEVAALLTEIRRAYVQEPDEAVASRHLDAIAREAELVRPRRTGRPAAWRRTFATLGAATLAAILGTAGLAAAGVDLPDQAQTAFDKVGITLPNQAGGGQSGDHARSDEVHSIIDATDPSDRGCEFGHSVAAAAKGEDLPPQAQGACDHGDQDGDGDATNQSSHSQFGKDTAARAKTLGDATVEQRRDFGKGTADQAQGLGGAQDAPAANQRPASTPQGDTTAAPDGTADGPPDTAPVPDGTPTGPPDGTPGGRP
jgi:hypothetical protein